MTYGGDEYDYSLSAAIDRSYELFKENGLLRKELKEQKVHTDSLRAQLESSRQYRREVLDSNAFLKNQAKDLNAECARRRNENKGLQVLLDEQEKELARMHSDPFTRRTAELEEENARLEADNAQLLDSLGSSEHSVQTLMTTKQDLEARLVSAIAKRDLVVTKRDEEIAGLKAQIDGLKADNKQLNDIVDYADGALTKAYKERDEACDHRVLELQQKINQMIERADRFRADLAAAGDHL